MVLRSHPVVRGNAVAAVYRGPTPRWLATRRETGNAAIAAVVVDLGRVHFPVLQYVGLKLPSYILPVFPALALFAAMEMQRMAPTTLSHFAWGLAATGGVLLLVVLVGGGRIAHMF